MKEASLPSPGVGSKSMHLRRIVANAISAFEITAPKYTNGAHPGATALVAFLAAAQAAAATVGKAVPAMTFTTAGNATTVAPAATLVTTVAKGGSSGAVSYTSSNPAAATVNASTGVITGVASGTTVISAIMAEGTAHKARTLTVTIINA